MAVPGLGLVFARHDALAMLRTTPRPEYYLDLVGEYDKQRVERAPRFGQPVQLHAAVHAACQHLRHVGIAQHHRRIRTQLEQLTAHLESLGCVSLLAPEYRGWVAGNFVLPPGLLYPEFCALMAAEGFYILYGAIEDPTQFQLCTMGDLSQDDIAALCSALTRVLAARSRAVA